MVNTPCQDCVYARRAAAQVHRDAGWTACWLPVLFQAGEAYTPLMDPTWRDEDLHDLSTLFAARMDVEEAATGWADNVRPDSTAPARAMYNGILLLKGVRQCPFKQEDN